MFLSQFSLLVFFLNISLQTWTGEKLKDSISFLQSSFSCDMALPPISTAGCRWQQGALAFLKQIFQLMEIAVFLPCSLHSHQELVRLGGKQVGL